MAKILWYLIVYGSSIMSLVVPWIGVVVGYFIVILGPQFIWFWGVPSRPFFTVTIAVIIGCLYNTLSGQLEYSRLKSPINLSLLVWYVFIIFSYLLGPYSDVTKSLPLGSQELFSTYQKIFLFYTVAVILIDNRKKFFFLIVVFMLSVIYLTYWANMRYLSGVFFLRLAGPRSPIGSAYGDENVFALLFVVGGPFFYYFGWLVKNKLLRIIFWSIVPFTWHAVFLTASRGGLLGIVSTIFIAAMRSPKKFLGLLLIPVFFFIYQWQGGSIMKNRAETITKYNKESSAQTRIQAWQAAVRMIKDNPFCGVGLGSFFTAFSDYSDKTPREAHNTFFQISAECGILAGINWVILLYLMFKTLNKASKYFKNKDDFMYLTSEALFVSLFGFTVCAMFLSLHIYEIFFYFCLLVHYIYINLKQHLHQ